MQVSVVKDGKEVTKLVATPEKASFFGPWLASGNLFLHLVY